MKKIICILLALAFLCTAKAQEQKPVSKNKPSEDLENLQLAAQLAKYGYKTFSADALIEAAKIMSSVKTQDLKYESYKQDPSPKEQTTKKAKRDMIWQVSWQRQKNMQTEMLNYWQPLLK